jgi:hypothetical protein
MDLFNVLGSEAKLEYLNNVKKPDLRSCSCEALAATTGAIIPQVHTGETEKTYEPYISGMKMSLMSSGTLFGSILVPPRD